jgi:hypothetical protein
LAPSEQLRGVARIRQSCSLALTMFGFDARAPPARHDKDRRTLYILQYGRAIFSRPVRMTKIGIRGAHAGCWVASRCILGLPETVDTDPVGGSLERRDRSESF